MAFMCTKLLCLFKDGGTLISRNLSFFVNVVAVFIQVHFTFLLNMWKFGAFSKLFDLADLYFLQIGTHPIR